MKLCYFLNRSSIVLRSRIEEQTKDERRQNENLSKTEREPIEDRSRSYRVPNASRTHPEGKQSDSIRKNAPPKPEQQTTDCLRHITEQYLHDELRRGLHYQHIQTLQNFPEKYV